MLFGRAAVAQFDTTGLALKISYYGSFCIAPNVNKSRETVRSKKTLNEDYCTASEHWTVPEFYYCVHCSQNPSSVR